MDITQTGTAVVELTPVVANVVKTSLVDNIKTSVANHPVVVAVATTAVVASIGYGLWHWAKNRSVSQNPWSIQADAEVSPNPADAK